MRQVLLSRVVLVTFAVTMVPAGWSLFAQTPTSAVVAEIQIPGADIVGLSVGGNGELAVYDRTPGVSNSLLRFFSASLELGGLVVTEAPETVTLGGNAPAFAGWMLRDGGLLYALSERYEYTVFGIGWSEMWVHIISGRTRVGFINYNDTVDIDGGSPSSAPEDFRYWVNGFTLKPANAESGNNTRLIIDDNIKGNLDILDLDSSGTALVSQERHSYRGRYEINCDWPDLSGSPWSCLSFPAIIGNSLALEWTLDTRSSPSEPSLANDDDLYILDPMYIYPPPAYNAKHLRRIKLSHPGAPVFSAVAQADIDLEDIHWFIGGNGVESIHAAPSTDRIWIATSLHDGVQGWVPVFDTLNLTGQVFDPVYADEVTVLVDPTDHNHVIIPTNVPFAYPSTLILQEVQNGVVVNSVTALTNYDDYSLDAAAYDPLFGIVYLAIGDMLWAVAATAPTVEIFSDDFESGNTSKWSASSK